MEVWGRNTADREIAVVNLLVVALLLEKKSFHLRLLWKYSKSSCFCARSGSPGVGQKFKPLERRDSSSDERFLEEKLTTVFFLLIFIKVRCNSISFSRCEGTSECRLLEFKLSSQQIWFTSVGRPGSRPIPDLISSSSAGGSPTGGSLAVGVEECVDGFPSYMGRLYGPSSFVEDFLRRSGLC